MILIHHWPDMEMLRVVAFVIALMLRIKSEQGGKAFPLHTELCPEKELRSKMVRRKN